jgi:CheY-like chemotaxis protein
VGRFFFRLPRGNLAFALAASALALDFTLPSKEPTLISFPQCGQFICPDFTKLFAKLHVQFQKRPLPFFTTKEVGKGTTFKVYFPAQTEPSATVGAEIAAEMPRGNGELILVVDDEISVRQITQQTLEAVSIYAQRKDEIALVLTDMMMPVMDGPATIAVLKRMNPKVRIIAASGLLANGHVAHAARLGVKHFLPKPYTARCSRP